MLLMIMMIVLIELKMKMSFRVEQAAHISRCLPFHWWAFGITYPKSQYYFISFLKFKFFLALKYCVVIMKLWSKAKCIGIVQRDSLMLDALLSGLSGTWTKDGIRTHESSATQHRGCNKLWYTQDYPVLGEPWPVVDGRKALGLGANIHMFHWLMSTGSINALTQCKSCLPRQKQTS